MQSSGRASATRSNNVSPTFIERLTSSSRVDQAHATQQHDALAPPSTAAAGETGDSVSAGDATSGAPQSQLAPARQPLEGAVTSGRRESSRAQGARVSFSLAGASPFASPTRQRTAHGTSLRQAPSAVPEQDGSSTSSEASPIAPFASSFQPHDFSAYAAQRRGSYPSSFKASHQGQPPLTSQPEVSTDTAFNGAAQTAAHMAGRGEAIAEARPNLHAPDAATVQTATEPTSNYGSMHGSQHFRAKWHEQPDRTQVERKTHSNNISSDSDTPSPASGAVVSSRCMNRDIKSPVPIRRPSQFSSEPSSSAGSRPVPWRGTAANHASQSPHLEQAAGSAASHSATGSQTNTGSLQKQSAAGANAATSVHQMASKLVGSSDRTDTSVDNEPASADPRSLSCSSTCSGQNGTPAGIETTILMAQPAASTSSVSLPSRAQASIRSSRSESPGNDSSARHKHQAQCAGVCLAVATVPA
jgi:hypothetical protein